MGELAADAYNAAKGTEQPPAGWARASEHPELITRYAPSLHISRDQLNDMLKPDESGFRAEIYLPDPAVLGPDYKPVVAFKGSSGDVLTSDGKLHSTTQEDFLANNFPQSVGMRTDYYDRAMRLSRELQRGGLDFELTGHSLAGGMAAAASAVTGNHATTWNAAGLHPETARRFAAENPGVVVHDISKSINSYQVQGELLNNGVQGNIHSLDYLQRQELGAVLQEGSQLLNQLPQGRELLKQNLAKNMPPEAQKTVQDFIDKVATGDTNKMLRELPLAAGQQQPLLAPMMPSGPDGTVLIARKNQMSLPEVTYLAKPLLETAGAVAKGAQLGHQAGEVVAAGGKVTNQALHATGGGIRNITEMGGQAARTVTQAGGHAAQGAEHLAGAAAAHGRVAVGEVGARVSEGLGSLGQFTASLEADALRKVGSVLPDGAQKWMNNQAQQLDRAGDAVHRLGQGLGADARRDAHADAATIRDATRTLQAATDHVATRLGNLQHDAVAGAGTLAGRGLDAVGNAVQHVAD
ncbi:MAG TPA: phospholipase, partial [Dyella sp.]|uniref:phospholipase n=1 Tax=Dyella sp. TaxID=1869338 RepID=UPI002F957D63